MHTPVNPSFAIIKVGAMGYRLHGRVIPMLRNRILTLRKETAYWELARAEHCNLTTKSGLAHAN